MVDNIKTSITTEFFPKYPPFNGEPRKFQGETIDEIFEAVESGEKFIVLAAPTGSGKSVMLYTLARAICKKYDGKAMFTTSQKVLQDQYEKDFPDMFVLKGRSNYPCHQPIDDTVTATCDNGICIYRPKDLPDCKPHCPYMVAKQNAILSDMVITNFSYLILESNHVGSFGIRKVLIIDEAHNIENVLMSYVECTISEFVLKYCEFPAHLINPPDFEFFDQYENWLINVKAECKNKIEKLTEEIENNPSSIFTDKIKKFEKITSIHNKIAFMFYNKDKCRWIVDFDKDKKKVVFKPINVTTFAQGLVFQHADVVIMSSATISESYVKHCLGVEKFKYIEVPSTFPVENRPIKCLNTGKMGYRDLDRTLPNIVKTVDFLLGQHQNEKGIIHATSYKIANYIIDNTQCYGRIITHNTKDRMEKLKEHMESDFPSVLLSPSMTEGIDLKDDLSRFQIIVKIPFPSLADKQIVARMQEDKVWYANLAAVTIMQAYGRSVRSKTDHALTYILDSGFRYFLVSNQDLFCQWFKEAIK